MFSCKDWIFGYDFFGENGFTFLLGELLSVDDHSFWFWLKKQVVWCIWKIIIVLSKGLLTNLYL